jgi:hypothetical protein
VKLFGFISLWCLLLVMPVNFTVSGRAQQQRQQPPARQRGLWAPVLPACLLSWCVARPHALSRARVCPPQGGYLERHKRPASSSGGGGGHHHTAAPAAAEAAAAALATSAGASAGGAFAVPSLGNFTDAIHTNLDLLTLSNVPPGSAKMWLHLLSVYVITLFALKVCGVPRVRARACRG